MIENHKFDSINTIFWRNSDLNFSNSVSLINSLDKKPDKEWLRRIHECEDEKVLKYFLDKNNTKIDKNNETQIKLLW